VFSVSLLTVGETINVGVKNADYPSTEVPRSRFSSAGVLRGQEITISVIRVYLRSSVDFLNVHLGLYR
jgi:hypothetical protein